MVSISQERAALAKVGLTLRRREQWGAVHDYSYPRSVTEPATRVFVHITITNPGNYRSNDAHARAVEAIGRSRFGKARSNTGISYNRGIMPNAAAYEFQPMGRRGAHTVNDKRLSSCRTSGCPGSGSSLSAPSYNLNYNARSYVICQNVQHSVSDAMVDAVARCIAADKLAGLVTRGASIHGHRCVSAKSCPGDRMWARMRDVQRRVDQYVKAGSVGGAPQEDDVSAKDNWKYRGYDYVNKKPTTKDHQQARTHEYTHGQPKRVWSRRWPWRNAFKKEFPKTAEKYPNGYTMQALLQWCYIFLRRMRTWDWLVNTLGRAVWSRRAGGDGDMHATRLGRADRNSAKAVELGNRAVAIGEANNALLAKLVDRDESNPLNEERVRAMFQEALANNLVQVDASVADAEDDSAPPEVPDSEDDDQPEAEDPVEAAEDDA